MNGRAMPRTKPPGFDSFPITVFHCPAPGLAEHDFDVKAEFEAKFGSEMGPVEVWIDATLGNDSNNGSRNNPLRTVYEASRRPGVGRIWVKPGVYVERFDLRSSSAPVAGGASWPAYADHGVWGAWISHLASPRGAASPDELVSNGDAVLRDPSRPRICHGVDLQGWGHCPCAAVFSDT